jgi:hypothetical protein
MPDKPRPKILGQNKVEGGAEGTRWFLISWTSDDAGSSRRCSTHLQERLSSRARDSRKRPIGGVQISLTEGGQSADQRAGTELVAGGNASWTDFVAIVTSRYALANRGNPRDPENTDPVGDFARAIAQVDAAEASDTLRLWAAVVERGGWREHRVAGRDLGEVELLRVLLNDPLAAGTPLKAETLADRAARIKREKLEIIVTTPPDTFDRHLGAALDQLLDPPPLRGND